jgi:hypothetical protein
MNDHPTISTWRLAASVLCSLALLVSCGGGVDSGGTGAPSASALSAGPVNGLGSVIANGVRFDDSGATIEDQDGNALTVDQIQVGMVARIDSGAVQTAGGQQTATALAIRTSNELIGPIGSIDLAGAAMVVLGQTVRITPATWFDAALRGGVPAVRSGQVVEVFGQYNARTNEYIATRIAPRPNAPVYEIRGVLSASNPAAHSLVVGGLAISDASSAASALPALTVGRFVRVTLGTAPTGSVWNAVTIAPGNTALPDRPDVRIAGRISSFTSAAQFVLNGLSIDASNATYPAGSAGIALGARVVVTGSTTGGVLSAATVTVKGDETAANSTYEFHGTITALNAAASTLVVRGITVSYSSSVQFTGGTIGDLAIGRAIAVVGTVDPNRTSIDAQTIGF